MKAKFNHELEGVKSEYKKQIDEMTTRIQEMSMSNNNLQ